MEYLSGWITNVLLFILLATVVELLLPQTNLQKYVKMVLGLLLMVIILTPIFKIFSIDPDQLLSNAGIMEEGDNFSLENSIEDKKKEIQADQSAYILEQMAVQLKNAAEEELMEQFGLQIEAVQLHLKDEFTSIPENPANIMESIENIEVVLGEAEDSGNSIEAVQEVRIDTTESEQQELTRVDESVAKVLSQNWGVDMDTIRITVERGSSGE